jgi:DnaK suppressor protein
MWETRSMKSESLGEFDGPGKHGGTLTMAAADDLPDGYRPSADEAFMNPRQQAYFRRKLLDWKEQILKESESTLEALKAEPLREPDLTDRAASETDWGIELRTRDRQRKLVSKIDSALRRIDSGEYGYCEVTGDPIGLRRLIARPVATMTVEAQEAHERREKVSRDD